MVEATVEYRLQPTPTIRKPPFPPGAALLPTSMAEMGGVDHPDSPERRLLRHV
jgi:hypothetical protein